VHVALDVARRAHARDDDAHRRVAETQEGGKLLLWEQGEVGV
jgi:hypothetical protein